MFIRSSLAAVVLTGSLLLSAAPVEAQDRPLVEVVVQNHGYYDMHVYAVQDGTRQTIGFVTGVSTRSLELPRTFAESLRDVQIYADPIAGSNAFLSDRLLVAPGDRIIVTLHNNNRLSSVFVTDQPSDEDGDGDDDPQPDAGQSATI